MSTYEQDREDRAVGPELCDECDHPLRLHGPEGCEFERGDRWVTGNQAGEPTVLMAMGPCGCSATTVEPAGIESLPESDWQAMLGAMFQRLLAEGYARARTRNLTGFLQQSSPLVGVHRLDVSFDELEAM